MDPQELEYRPRSVSISHANIRCENASPRREASALIMEASTLISHPGRRAAAPAAHPLCLAAAPNAPAVGAGALPHLVQGIKSAVQGSQAVGLQACHQGRQQLRPPGKAGCRHQCGDVGAHHLAERPRLVADRHQQRRLRVRTRRPFRLAAPYQRATLQSRLCPPAGQLMVGNPSCRAGCRS